MHQAEHILIIGDAKIAADLIFLNIRRTDDDYDLCLVGKLHKHTQFAVRLKMCIRDSSCTGIASYGFPALSHCYEENTGAAGKKRKCDFYKE